MQRVTSIRLADDRKQRESSHVGELTSEPCLRPLGFAWIRYFFSLLVRGGLLRPCFSRIRSFQTRRQRPHNVHPSWRFVMFRLATKSLEQISFAFIWLFFAEAASRVSALSTSLAAKVTQFSNPNKPNNHNNAS